MPSRVRRLNLTDRQKAEIIELWSAGEKGEYVAAKVGCSVGSVYNVTKAAGLGRGRGNRAIRQAVAP